MIRDDVRDLDETAGFAEDDVLCLELAAEEAFMNILKHAYPDVSQGRRAGGYS
jgi:anti-sigma regulatory factor (Ser/Thr protein kinase)